MFSSNQTNVAAVPNYIEDVFATWLYTGSASAQTITNNIDLSTKGGLVWTKDRTTAGYRNSLSDTANGVTKYLISEFDNGIFGSGGLASVTSSGYTLTGGGNNTNIAGDNFVGWTFRKQPKFFDVVTYTGTGSNTTIAHSLGSVPGCIMVKRTDTTGDWQVYHSSLANTEYLVLNTTAAKATGATRWNSTTPTSTVFSVGTDATVNASGGTYVAYIFAHNAGGFGLIGTDNVISCGSVVNTGNPQVTLGYEPQWVLFKSSTSTSSWYIVDNMRGLPVGSDQAVLSPNASSAEVTNSNYININATGFTTNSSLIAGETLIYIAIRRGPMAVPTDATKVYTGSLANPSVSIDTGFVPDLAFSKTRNSTSPIYTGTRLQGNSVALITSNTTSEGGFGWQWDRATNTFMQTSLGSPVIDWIFARAPSVMDVVCYTGTGSATTQAHNLAAVPELMIFKRRSASASWGVYCNKYNGGVNANQYYQILNQPDAESSGSGLLNNTNPTLSLFTVGTWNENNASGSTYVAYLFATCAGVSKVGSYTGTGATQTISCGFTGGARWVMVKRTDSTGDWYVWDTARGMVVGTDPSLLLNANASEVNANSIYTATGGFQIVSTAAGINASGGSYIFLAIA